MSNKKTVLYVHHAHSQAGAPRSLSFLIEQLDQQKYQPYVLCCYDYQGNKALFEKAGAICIYEKYMAGWHGSTVSGASIGSLIHHVIRALPTYFNMRKCLKVVKPDIVHLNSSCLFMCAKAVKDYNKDIPLICHIREPLLPNFFGDILKYFNNKYVDQYVAIEEFDAESMKPTNVPIEIVYNAVNFESYNTQVQSTCLRDEIHLAQDDVVFLYLARIAPCNGAYEMLQAIENVLKQNPKLHLCLVGAEIAAQDSYSQGVLKIAQRNTAQIHVLPFRTDVPQVIASSDVMLVPFQEPHFARSVVEAGAMGVPCIASNIGGLDELVVDGETGYFFDYKTFDGFVEKCTLLATDVTLRKQLGENARARVEELFTKEKVNIEIKKLYKEIK